MLWSPKEYCFASFSKLCIKCTSCDKAVMLNRYWSKGLSLKVVTVVGSMYYQRMFNWEITILMDAILVQF